MNIEHVAIWTQDIERLKAFYCDVLGGTAGPVYHSARRPFTSYFITFASGARLELMHLPTVRGADIDTERPRAGYAHLAFSAGSVEQVDELSARLRDAGCLLGEPRHTGDGYYESLARDPDGNLIEITV